MSVNVLLTCAGRRNYLLNYFREALNAQGRVLAADADPYAPAMQEADRALVVPPVTSPDYVDNLLAICRDNKVALLISLNDLELGLLARQRERFLQVGTIPVVSSPDVVDTCFDKWATVKFLRDSGLAAPQTYPTLPEARAALEQGDLSFPLVIKPRWGSASIGIEYLEDEHELELAYQLTKQRLHRTILADASAADYDRAILIQERLAGQEYGLDVINDLQGNYVTTFVKRKLAMRAGETDSAVTVEDRPLQKLGETIGKYLGHVGNLDCDVFVNENGAYVLELNPRFGGGYPFSQVAGANLPAALLAWARGEKLNPEWLQVTPGVAAAKCDRLVVCDHHQALSE